MFVLDNLFYGLDEGTVGILKVLKVDFGGFGAVFDFKLHANGLIQDIYHF